MVWHLAYDHGGDTRPTRPLIINAGELAARPAAGQRRHEIVAAAQSRLWRKCIGDAELRTYFQGQNEIPRPRGALA
jgi:hypothetical protein